MATFLQAQRRGLRGYLGQAWAKMGIETSAEASETPSRTKLCSKCRAISAKLEELLDRGFDGPDGIPIMGQRVTAEGDLKHVVKPSQRKKCSLCNFLAPMVEDYLGPFIWMESSTRYVSLFVGSAKGQYGISEDVSQVPQSFFLWIWQLKRDDGWPSGPLSPYGPLLPYNGDGHGSGSSGMALELSNDPGKISGRVIEPQINFELVRSWFDDCATHHGDTCRTEASMLQNIPGFRVIDCLSQRLVWWSELPETQDRQYVALSYVWGTEPDDDKASWLTWFQNAVWETRGHETVKTPQPSSDSTADGRLPSNLPQLIEDAIIAVIKLRFRYLWVDRYCIPQDNSEAKHTQIQSMDRIYGSACLTIIAAAGDDPSYGLAGVSPRSGRVSPRAGRDQASLSTSVRIGSRTFVTVGTEDFPKKLKKSKWNNRAWTMQEAFLSCRCLVFLDDGAYFQCSSSRSHRFEAIHEPPALLQFRHEVLSREEHNNRTQLPDSVILTKAGRAGGFKFDWCLQLVEEYFPRSMTFENDSLNAFSGMLKYLQSLEPPIHNLWGVLMLPDVASTVSGQRISYNLVCGLAWSYEPDNFAKTDFGPLEETTILPRKEIFPSWTWVDWRSKSAFDGEHFTSRHRLDLPYQDSSFTCLVDLSVELDDGRIVSCGQGYDSDVLWLTTLPEPPRILHVNGYTSNPQLRYMTEADLRQFRERTIIPTTKDLSEDGRTSQDHSRVSLSHHWELIDADGEHLQLPLEGMRDQRRWWGFSEDAYHLQRQRGYQTESIKLHTESAFDFRIILLGYNQRDVFYMVLMKVPGTDGHTETFERVNVLRESWPTEPTTQRDTQMAELLAKLTGKHANSFPGTPWVKMSTRIA